MKIDYIGMLLEFHRKYRHYEFFGHSVDNETIDLRIRLIDEEVNKELLPALESLKGSDHLTTQQWFEKMIETSDAVADSLYVIFGTCISLGIPIDEIFTEVHRSNMTKSLEKTKYGKTIKGPNFELPRLKEIYERYLRQG